MATEISSDLINQLNLSLRKNAKLSSLDSSSLSLPTAPEAIAELDASPPYLRCRNCKGKLLRGIESLICVFCGEQQRTSDNAPDPIKLTSTFAYKWFLTALDLDGSEMVEAIKETSGSSRGAKVPVVKGVALSEFLDFEVKWCARDETSDGVSVQKKSPLNLGGISLDDYFVEERGDLSKVDTEERKAVEDDDFKDPRSLSLFDSVKSPEVVESQQNDNVGLVKGNDAKKNESLSLFAGRDGQDEDENLSLFDGKAAPGTSSSIKDDSFGFFGSSDAQRTSSSKEDESFGFFEGKDAQRNSASKEDGNLGLFEGKDDQRNSSSKEDESFGLFEGAPSSDDKVVASSSDWDSDFQSVSQEKISSDPFVSSPADLSAHMDSVFGSGKQADSSTAYVSKAGDWLQDDLFGNVTGKSQNNDKNEGQVLGGNGSSSMDIDWIGDDLWQTSEKKAIEKTPTNDDDDDWNDFASSANSKTPSNLLSRTMERSQEDIFDGMSHVKEQSEYEKQNTATSMISDIAKGQEDDDLFGTWDSFASSTVLQTPVQPPTNHVNQSAEQNQGMNLFGESNQQSDLDSGLFSESIGGQTYSEEVKAMPSGTLTSERTGDPDGQDQVTTVSRKSKSDVAEELMSQMHDLSFMLETKLSVPPISKAE
ncbi:BnaA08g28180D [Brassica napus]|uniref:BnaA08g28180D protein n=1 Tax=Brassica napus TaxID=3708 RepID=A0A078FRQ0_BRANA|nr:BnaA08g28180D [Brassica napus]